LIALPVLFALLGVVCASDARDKRSPVETTINRGLTFLVKDALAWKNTRKCVSCHHASLVVWSMREAKQRGHAVDEPVLAELTKWIAESGDGKVNMARPASAPKAQSSKALHFALGLESDPRPEPKTREGLKLLLKTVQSEQTENGSWSSWPETRPPIFGTTDEIATLLATLAFTSPVAAGDPSAKLVRDKGIQWLSEHKAGDDLQAITMRLVLWKRLDRPNDECEPLLQRIKGRQNADGGFSQIPGMPSDAWGTGQALYALACAGFKPEDPLAERARAFLIKTQRANGSWPMTSRPTKPGGAGSKSLVPITCAGSAWAVLGLVRSR
jgi:squalene cyclase